MLIDAAEAKFIQKPVHTALGAVQVKRLFARSPLPV